MALNDDDSKYVLGCPMGVRPHKRPEVEDCIPIAASDIDPSPSRVEVFAMGVCFGALLAGIAITALQVCFK